MTSYLLTKSCSMGDSVSKEVLLEYLEWAMMNCKASLARASSLTRFGYHLKKTRLRLDSVKIFLNFPKDDDVSLKHRKTFFQKFWIEKIFLPEMQKKYHNNNVSSTFSLKKIQRRIFGPRGRWFWKFPTLANHFHTFAVSWSVCQSLEDFFYFVKRILSFEREATVAGLEPVPLWRYSTSKPY